MEQPVEVVKTTENVYDVTGTFLTFSLYLNFISYLSTGIARHLQTKKEYINLKKREIQNSIYAFPLLLMSVS